MANDRIDVLGVGFDNLTMDEAVSRALELVRSRSGQSCVTPNPEIVWLARGDSELREALSDAALVLPDGIGVIYGSRILGRGLRSKIPGIDFASALFARLAESKGSVFLFGSKPGIAEAAGERLASMFPGLRIVGCENGYFSDSAPIISSINAAKPDVLLVCLGAPKQEKWMHEHEGELEVGLMAGLGGSLDVFAGAVQRAPEAWQRLGLEWLHRLLKEPKRIKRMIKLPLFLFAVIAQRIRGGSNGR